MLLVFNTSYSWFSTVTNIKYANLAPSELTCISLLAKHCYKITIQVNIYQVVAEFYENSNASLHKRRNVNININPNCTTKSLSKQTPHKRMLTHSWNGLFTVQWRRAKGEAVGPHPRIEFDFDEKHIHEKVPDAPRRPVYMYMFSLNSNSILI